MILKLGILVAVAVLLNKRLVRIKALSTQPIFKLRNLSKHIKLPTQDISILQNINLDINYGEILAIKGVSGVGKSTLLKIMSGIETATTGTLLFEGSDLTRLNAVQLSEYRLRKIGMVFQDFRLLEHLTVLENVMLVCELQGMEYEKCEQLAISVLEQVHMQARFNMYPKTLSGGERQRAAIARAWVTSPKVIMADEPTGQLDRNSTKQILKLIENINNSKGTAVIIATHDPLVVEICSRVVEIQDGAIVDEAND
ncbi:MAG: ABC transporter ATP-binding protein [Francisellaceae bacterium]|jgi:putative ABC transport system ATP-binding protein|nr:ABC transporter ATP-binding protein [Francisellaceae bacterium]MBT6206707.1 ABC transporter ATP-binding protein [Francisellaceae bacterium]MBT6539931.1 ABC transporter ATP-binding protein [Francisellaceae bacterium]